MQMLKIAICLHVIMNQDLDKLKETGDSVSLIERKRLYRTFISKKMKPGINIIKSQI